MVCAGSLRQTNMQYLTHIDDQNNSFFLMTKFSDDGKDVTLMLNDGINGWKGQGSLNEMSRAKESLMSQLKCALTEGGSQFEFSVTTNKDGSVKFIVKHCLDSGIKVQLCQTELKPQDDPSSVTSNMLLFAIQSLRDANVRLKQYNVEKELLVKDREAALKRLETVVQTKTTMENQLYDAAARLLNTKKRKCLELAEEVEELKEQVKSLQDRGKGPAVGKSSSRNTVQETTYSDSTDVDTDQEMDCKSPPPTREPCHRAVSGDSQSLMLDDEKSAETKTSIVPRRHRRNNARKTDATVAPSAVQSSQSSASRTLRHSLRKKSSTTSNNSDVNYDQLMEEL